MRHLLVCLLALLTCAGCGEDDKPTPKPDWNLEGAGTGAVTPTAEEGGGFEVVGSPDGSAAADDALPPAALPPLDAPLPDDGADAPEVADTVAAFDARMQQLIAACTGDDEAAAEADARALLLPDPRAWFGHAFGADHPRLDALVTEYEAKAAQLPTLPGAVRARIEAGQSERLIERFIDPEDDLATGYQAIALRNLAKPIGLYSLRMLKPDADSGWHLWSFAHVDGQFRFVGQMLALSPASAAQSVRDLGSLRVKDAKAILAKRHGAGDGK